MTHVKMNLTADEQATLRKAAGIFETMTNKIRGEMVKIDDPATLDAFEEEIYNLEHAEMLSFFYSLNQFFLVMDGIISGG